MSPARNRVSWLALLVTILCVLVLINRHTNNNSIRYSDGGVITPQGRGKADAPHSRIAGIRRGLSDTSDRHAPADRRTDPADALPSTSSSTATSTSLPEASTQEALEDKGTANYIFEEPPKDEDEGRHANNAGTTPQQDARRHQYLTNRNARPVAPTQQTSPQASTQTTSQAVDDEDEDRHNRLPVILQPKDRATNDPLALPFTGSVEALDFELEEERHFNEFFDFELDQENPDLILYTRSPSEAPSDTASGTPTIAGTTSDPTVSPTISPTTVVREITQSPTEFPSRAPSESPSKSPSISPSALPSTTPTVSHAPTISAAPTGSSPPSSSPSIATTISSAPTINGTLPPTSQPTQAVLDTDSPSSPPTVDCSATQSGFFGTLSNNATIVNYAYEIVFDRALLEDAANSNSTNETDFFLNTQVLPSVEQEIVDRVLPSLFASRCGEGSVATSRMAKPLGNRMLMKNSDLYRRQLELVGLYSRPEDVILPNEVCQVVENATDCRVVFGGISLFIENLGVNESETLEAQVLSVIRTSMNLGDFNDAYVVIVNLTFSDVTYSPGTRSIGDGIGERPGAGRLNEFALTTIIVGCLVMAFIICFISRYNAKPPLESNETFDEGGEDGREEGDDNYLVQDQGRSIDDRNGNYRDEYQDEPGNQSASYDGDGTTGSNSYGYGQY